MPVDTWNFNGPNKGASDGYVPNTLVSAEPVNSDLSSLHLDDVKLSTYIDTNLNTHNASASGVHGLGADGGNVVGTSKAQTLTHKTIVVGDNTISGISNVNIDNNADISWSKIDNAGVIVDDNISTNANIDWDKIVHAGKIVDNDIASTISWNKINAVGVIDNSNLKTKGGTYTGISSEKINLSSIQIPFSQITGTATTSQIPTLAWSKIITQVTSGGVTDGVIVNNDVKSNAAISYSKLNLNESIQQTDLAFHVAAFTSGTSLPSGGSNGDVYVRV